MIKLCKNCRFHALYTLAYGVTLRVDHVCTNPKNKTADLVTGEIRTKDCSLLRIGDSKNVCGEAGNWYEERAD